MSMLCQRQRLQDRFSDPAAFGDMVADSRRQGGLDIDQLAFLDELAERFGKYGGRMYLSDEQIRKLTLIIARVKR